MANSSLSLRFTVLFSLSLSAAFSFSPLPLKPLSLSSPPPPETTPKATPSDLLSLLGPNRRSSAINPLVARELQSCFKFLVPFAPNRSGTVRESRFSRSWSLRSNGNGVRTGREEEEGNELIWWPPRPVLELARLAVDSGGDPGAIQRALDPTIIPVPDVEGSKEVRCELTRTPYGRHFISEELNSYLEFLFELIVDRAPAIGLNLSLTRYDLFHGHLFITRDTGRIGILFYLPSVFLRTVQSSFGRFHAKEYPAFDREVFPYNMGYCHIGSNVTYDDSMNLRNILWLAPLPSRSNNAWEAPGVLVVLDAHPGGIIYRDIIPDYVNFVRTIYEDDLGDVVVDVNYLNVGDAIPNYQLFIC
ncbi:hypothetical protein TIFTF001_013098 [Ficus carica]|uniref:Uncharacterized protein n=1 Tax=Ficus carica TaxID=3494 RepID=A0AA88AH74_FICCA|nr:hypothetical protein TIFTF001_013098 [Ficus carica]